ncbi:hypothetical protein BCV72DRAFT_221361 [Rhizopus microsporus var. microsporus]|uniref:K Homology domain-containing protein n=2 Tax=Rhizopus microsporus TaxID=58291 RepID=A0A2G4SND2_RHIZD|nr:uncharacterized protein RHIMIDRAFT_260335 [Rhizopus microsporus ATCC 52813]ORE10599.1 hypothetical protein BCV72DRAFT_221361 [Rhizopus microsporus var. microsporus]PHZ10270.1 hypothetical protein RHIMIDRAFT_260335 [Rhizopus microsporus ATCC 52813]
MITESYIVKKSLHGLLIGKKGSRLKQLTEETGTQIRVQRGKDQVMVSGPDKESIEKAKLAIDRTLQQAQQRMRPTHFLSIPITNVKQQIEAFYKKIDTMVNPDALVLPANFHITLGVMSLLDREEIDRAVKYFKEECSIVAHQVLENGPLSVRLQKLAIMQPNPAEAHVLYIEPQDETQLLVKLCKAIIDKMIDGGFMKMEKRPLKLHATLVNTSHCKGKIRQPFDARSILQEHKEINFGQAVLDKVCFMKMGRTGPGRTYESEGHILL